MSMPVPRQPTAGTGAASGSTAWHVCHCGKSFARKEHLTRHQGTHGRLAYVCNICQRQFGRKDVLRRHSLLHQGNHARAFVSCDACRVNKTKCSGGTQCSLCARRGITCTFHSGGIRRSKRAPMNDAPPAGEASLHEDDHCQRVEWMAPPIQRMEALPVEDPLCEEEEEPHLPAHELFLNLKIVPSLPAPSGGLLSASPGMQTIYDLLLADRSPLDGNVEESDEFQEWIAKCLDAYLKNFHLRWPLINAPSFDLGSAPSHLAASIFVIGTWLRNDVEWTERSCALQVHKILLQYLLHELVDPEAVPEGRPWPLELFEATLLTLVFSLYRTDKCDLSRAMLLRSVFITRLREIGAFNTQLLNSHLKAHFSGTFTSYTFSMRERFNRLLGLTYQFDVYFALAYEKPPILHRQEVGADIPSTFAVWNAHPISVFDKRRLEEPPERRRFRISEMTDSPGSLPASQLLVEDVLLGLCGLLQNIWVLMQPLPLKGREYTGDRVQGVLLTKTLDGWKYELDKIRKLAETRNITTDAGRHLLMAYRGENTSMLASLERISTLVKDGMVLYYYLKMYHYSSLPTATSAEVAEQTEDTGPEARQTPKQGREALLYSLQLLRMVDSIRAPGTSINPLTKHALAFGFNITRTLVSYQKCECSTNGGQDLTTDIHQWTEIGGPISIDGTPVCECKLDFWTQRFKKSIQDQTIG